MSHSNVSVPANNSSGAAMSGPGQPGPRTEASSTGYSSILAAHRAVGVSTVAARSRRPVSSGNSEPVCR